MTGGLFILMTSRNTPAAVGPAAALRAASVPVRPNGEWQDEPSAQRGSLDGRVESEHAPAAALGAPGGASRRIKRNRLASDESISAVGFAAARRESKLAPNAVHFPPEPVRGNRGVSRFRSFCRSGVRRRAGALFVACDGRGYSQSGTAKGVGSPAAATCKTRIDVAAIEDRHRHRTVVDRASSSRPSRIRIRSLHSERLASRSAGRIRPFSTRR